MKILVVDDEIVSRKKMQLIMKRYGICLAFDNGKHAIDAFQNALKNGSPFDLVTLDVSMPDMDGREVLIKFRELEVEYNISKNNCAVILMVTANSDQQTVVSSIQAGCNDYVVKPFNKEKINDKLLKFGLL